VLDQPLDPKDQIVAIIHVNDEESLDIRKVFKLHVQTDASRRHVQGVAVGQSHPDLGTIFLHILPGRSALHCRQATKILGRA
jgi:hypothetical protein